MRIYEDLRVVQLRLAVVQYVVVGLIGLLLAEFAYLQVVRGRHYRALAENNRLRTIPLAAPRGPFVDRHGTLLVENRPAFNVVLIPELAEDLDHTVRRLAELLRMPESDVRKRLAERSAPYRTVLVKADAPLEDVATLEARRRELPSVGIDVVPLRSYPLRAAAAHALGRVGEVTERQLGQPQFADFEPGDLVGQAGLEALYNRELLGEDGVRRVIVNSRGAEVDEVERRPPREGPRLTLTLDAELQIAMERAFAERSGSAVALDPWTGEVLALTSTPAFDPNAFTGGIEPTLWKQLIEDSETPLMNRVVQGQYSPGSVFKIVMAAAALEEGLITAESRIACRGSYPIYGTVFRCNNPSGHGRLKLVEALTHSCNVFFYELGVRLEIGRIARHSRRLGLGAPTGIDLPHEVGGLVPSPEWKQRAHKLPWYPGETVSVAIGQGQVSATPLQLARLAALVANGGRLVRPHLVRAVGGEPVAYPPPEPVGLRPETVALIREGMRRAVNDWGTGWRARLPGVEVCGKTGSAQVVARARLEEAGEQAHELQPHAWFVSFAPADDPKLALAVLVEHGGSGGAAAAPVAREILARYFGVAETKPAVVAAAGGDR